MGPDSLFASILGHNIHHSRSRCKELWKSCVFFGHFPIHRDDHSFN